MVVLSKEQRNLLARVVLEARTVAEDAARKALHALGVDEPDPPAHLAPEQRDLRRALRAQARQLGDREDPARRGYYSIGRLAEKIGYDQWHRMLFARFLAENDLLISPEHGVGVSLDDCRELAPSMGLRDGWDVAARFAAQMLPQIFRDDDPAGRIEPAPEDRTALQQLVLSQPREAFLADDALGWVYQFWQGQRKDQINASGSKIGAEELAPVTQLFTEDYMVLFLLHNTIGAWWWGRRAPSLVGQVQEDMTEEELRGLIALPGVNWSYLRFVRTEPPASSAPGTPATPLPWRPAAGAFAGWPKTAKELRLLDPCEGSGHFEVAELRILTAMRMAEDDLTVGDACEAVLRDNIFGLELDSRCAQIAAFNLALAAWKLGGYRKLPPLNLACCGLGINARKDDWLKLAGNDERLRGGMDRLYELFRQAPLLGSLIDPRKSLGGGDLFMAGFHDLAPLLETALGRETGDDAAHEMAVVAQGLAKAAEILAGQFTLVATNVPYLGRGKQDDVLKAYCEKHHPDAKADLATCFVERCLAFCAPGGSTALVSPQNWWFLGSYRQMRQSVLARYSLGLIVTLGEEAWQSFGDRGPVAALMIATHSLPTEGETMAALDALPCRTIEGKVAEISQGGLRLLAQSSQRANPDQRIVVGDPISGQLLSRYAAASQGVSPADLPHFGRSFWEASPVVGVRFWQGAAEETKPYGGRSLVLWWNSDLERAVAAGQAFVRGDQVWGKAGVACRQMRELSCTLYTGDVFDTNTAVIVPFDQSHVPAVWVFCSSDGFQKAVRRVDMKVNVTNASMVKVPFDLEHWQQVAAEVYPKGLPKPHSDDPTQWLFYGHPNPAHPHGILNRDGAPMAILADGASLHVAVARLLGYRWPRQTGSTFPDCPALDPDDLEHFADADGIVCISAVKAEAPAAERLRALLSAAFGGRWSAALQAELLAQAGHGGKTLEDWLRNGFFEQHCQLFHHRPFIWHLWDGRRDGFSALVNYHKLDRARLEKLTYTYLGDWIGRQSSAVDANEEGSDARLQAARDLQDRLKLIIEGEAPYDIFVRWKPLAQQPLGWDPDLNDGVRLNIRPFLTVPDVGKKGAGILRWKPNINWNKDRGTDVPSAPWYPVFHGDRINDHHLPLAGKRAARESERM